MIEGAVILIFIFILNAATIFFLVRSWILLQRVRELNREVGRIYDRMLGEEPDTLEMRR